MWYILAFLVIVFQASQAPFFWERWAQILAMAIAYVASEQSNSTLLKHLIRTPLIWFLIMGTLFEILHMLYKRRSRPLLNTWEHLQRLRASNDLKEILSIKLSNDDCILHTSFEKV